MILIGLIAVYLVAAVLAFPLTFFLMLFLGNLGFSLGFWACYPGSLVLTTLATHTKFNQLN